MRPLDPLTAQYDALSAVQAAVLNQHRSTSSPAPKAAEAPAADGQSRAEPGRPAMPGFLPEGAAKAVYSELKVLFARHASEVAGKSWQV